MAVLIIGITSFIMSFCRSLNVISFLMILLGMGVNGAQIVFIVYLAEISADNFRNYSITTLNIVWALS